MFVLSMKTTRSRLAAYGVAAALLVAVCFGAAGQSVAVGTGISTDPVTYLRHLGYEVDPQWVSLREVAIPLEFDANLTAYNALQKEAGYDLTAYRGERVRCYTYTVQNYPGTDGVQATVYEYNNRIIGGDISATAAEGFSHGLTPLTPDEGENHGTTG